MSESVHNIIFKFMTSFHNGMVVACYGNVILFSTRVDVLLPMFMFDGLFKLLLFEQDENTHVK